MFSNLSVKKPYTVVVAVIIIAILGAVSIMNMSTDLLPSINLPYAVVSTSYMGASPEEVEMAVTRPIEQRMASVSNIKNIRSISREDSSLVILEFSDKANMDSVIIEMRESLDMLKAFMPEKVGTPIIMKLNPDMMPVMVVSAAVKGQSISQASQFLESRIVPEIESIEGVASVTTTGLINSEIHVILREDKINEINKKLQAAPVDSSALTGAVPAGLTPGGVPVAGPAMPEVSMPGIRITKEMVSGILQGQNFSMPSGYIVEDGVDYLVRTGDKVKDLEELRKIKVMSLSMPGMEDVYLEDVAEIAMWDNSATMYSKVNGNDAIILTIQKQTEYSTADIAKSIREKIDVIMEKNEGVDIVPLMDQGKYVDIVVNSISMNLIVGGLLAILILLIFLRDLKPTIIVGFAIPVSLVTAFVMMYFSRITLNIISMGGLALGVGMLVDNSIVVIENIYRMRGEGKSAKEAAVEGAGQVAGAIMASTFTTVAVFIPILFTHGLTRQIFTDMGLTIAYSLIASLIIALTLVPMMASNMMVKSVNKEHKTFNSMRSVYTRILEFSLRHKWLVILIVLVLFAGSIAGALRMGTEMFPASDSGQININMTMPKGTLLGDTAAAADEVVKVISELADVETVGATVGGRMFSMRGGSMRRSAGESVSIYVLLKDDRKMNTNEIAQLIRDKTEHLPGDIGVSSSGMDLSAMSGGAVSISIKGREFDILAKVSKDVEEIVSSVEGTVEVSGGIDEASPELRLVVDKDKSIARGLTVAQVYMEVSKLLRDDRAATTLNIGSKDYSIFVKDERAADSIDRDQIMEHIITTPQGERVAIKDIASMAEARGFMTINRTSQQRYTTVTAQLEEGFNVGLVSKEISDKLASYEAPEGYVVEMGGEREMITESFKDLLLMLAMAIAFIYLIMVAQFQSLLSPFIVMFTIPLAFTGGFMGLIATRKPVSVVAFVGLIVLAGVVVNNGIVFVDYVNKMREAGLSKREAIIKAGNDRIRPILMTALTTIFALSTMSFGAGTGTEMMQPMAITAIGGLIYATLLTIILIPVLYDSFHRKER